MPTPPPFPYKSAPVTYPNLPAAAMVEVPTMTLTFPFGCNGNGILQLDVMPTFDRAPEVLPDAPGGGYSYAKFLEYLLMGIAPTTTIGVQTPWVGRGAETWTVYIDGVASATIAEFDGTVGPIGVQIPPPGGSWSNPTYSIYLQATYHDRPEFRDFWIDPATVGVVSFGPSTQTIDPNVPYFLDGIMYGCCQRNAAFFPSIGWGSFNYHDPWVTAHHDVADTSGPVDRLGNYLPLTGPWGASVSKQYLAPGPGLDPCPGSPCLGGSLPSGAGGTGDVYATGLDLVSTTTYPEITYPVTTPTQVLAGCTPTTSNPVFDVTSRFKAHS